MASDQGVIKSSGFGLRVKAEIAKLDDRLDQVAELLERYSVSREEIASVVTEKIGELADARRFLAL